MKTNTALLIILLGIGATYVFFSRKIDVVNISENEQVYKQWGKYYRKMIGYDPEEISNQKYTQLINASQIANGIINSIFKH